MSEADLDAKIMRDLLNQGMTEEEASDALANIRKLRKEKPKEETAPYFQYLTRPPKKAESIVKTAKKGGYVRAADGIAKRGKTRGRIVR